MRIVRHVAAVLLAVLTVHSVSLSEASAQQNRLACGQGLVERRDPTPLRTGIVRTAVRVAASEAGIVPMSFIGHATFLIRSPQGVNVVTDYNDNYRADVLPDIATMNTDRGNHRTYRIEPSIAHALKGWDSGEGIPYHDVTYKDVRVYSEPTSIVRLGDRSTNDTAIFVIQVAGLCIAHLGHTAHTLDDALARRLGTIDIALTPVDRIVTQSYEEIFHNIGLLKPRIIVPMHDIGWTTQQFLSEAAGRFPVRRDLGHSVQLSRATLPRDTEVWVLQPRRGRYGSD